MISEVDPEISSLWKVQSRCCGLGFYQSPEQSIHFYDQENPINVHHALLQWSVVRGRLEVCPCLLIIPRVENHNHSLRAYNLGLPRWLLFCVFVSTCVCWSVSIIFHHSYRGPPSLWCTYDKLWCVSQLNYSIKAKDQKKKHCYSV